MRSAPSRCWPRRGPRRRLEERTLENPEALDALELGARRIDFVGLKFQASGRLRGALRPGADAGGPATSRPSEVSRCCGPSARTTGGLRTFATATRCCASSTAGVAARQPPYWLQTNLDRYDQSAQLWVGRAADRWQSQVMQQWCFWIATHTLPAWYRFKVVLPAHHAPLALHVPRLGESCQFFANGRLIGQFGRPPEQERAYQASPEGAAYTDATPGQIIPLPADIADGAGSVTIAIRVWYWSGWAFFAWPPPAVTIGDASLLNDQLQLKQDHWFWLLSVYNVLLLGNLLAAFAGLGLFLLRRGEREYLWFAAVELLNAALCAKTIFPVFHPVWYQPYESLNMLLFFSLYGICLPMFFETILREPRGRLFWGAMVSQLVCSLTVVPMAMGWMSWQTWIPVVYLAQIPNVVCLILLLAFPARRGEPGCAAAAHPLLPAICSHGRHRAHLADHWLRARGASVLVLGIGMVTAFPMAISNLRAEHRRLPDADFDSHHPGAALCPAPAATRSATHWSLRLRAPFSRCLFRKRFQRCLGSGSKASISLPDRWAATFSRFFRCMRAGLWWRLAM
jgi:hypothetical protein